MLPGEVRTRIQYVSVGLVIKNNHKWCLGPVLGKVFPPNYMKWLIALCCLPTYSNLHMPTIQISFCNEFSKGLPMKAVFS